MAEITTHDLPAREGLTLLRLRLLGVPQPNALKHLKLLPSPPGYKPDSPGPWPGPSLVGRTFGRLTVVRRAADNYALGRTTRWWCRCQCGNTVVTRRCALITGGTKSCGCLQREIVTKASYKHGHNPHDGPQSPEYRSWAVMLHRYRHLTCKRWHSFAAFLEDMGPKPPGSRLRRVRLYKGYRPGNVVWQ